MTASPASIAAIYKTLCNQPVFHAYLVNIYA